MKIAMASNDEIKIASHLGRTNGFVIVDLEDGKVKDRQYRKNDFTGHKRGMMSSGHDPGRFDPTLVAFKDSDLEVPGIETYLTEEEDVAKAINLFAEDKLDNNPEKGCDYS